MSARPTRWGRGVRARIAVFAVVGAVAVVYVGARYAQLTDKVVPTTYGVRVQLAESGGLFPGAEVTYRGVPVGRVGSVVPSEDGIEAEVRIRNRWRIPADARAEVHTRSAVGEQYLDLVPPDESGPSLRDGSTIRRDRTSTPLPEQELLASLDGFVQSVDTDDLGTVVSELGDAFQGTGEDLGRILDGSTALVEAARTNLPATVRLLRHTTTVLGTQRSQASALRSFSHDLSLLTGTVRARDADLRSLITGGSSFARESSRLLRAVRPGFDRLVRDLGVLGAITRRGLSSLEQMLVALPRAVQGTQAGVRDHRAQFVFQLTPSPTACSRGYLPPDQRRSTRDVTLAPPLYDISCTDPSTNHRGSAHVP